MRFRLFRQFLPRGLEKIGGEWSLICAGHNLQEPFRYGAVMAGSARRNRPVLRNGEFAETVSTALAVSRPRSEWPRPVSIVVATCSS